MSNHRIIPNGSPIIEMVSVRSNITLLGTVTGYDALLDRYRIVYDVNEGISTPKWVEASKITLDV